MTEHTFALAPFYKGWDGYQYHLIYALTPLSAEQLALRVAPHLRPIGTIATHIIGARARWMHYVLREGDENLVSLSRWDHPEQPVRSAAELVRGLEATWQVILEALHRWTIADLDEIFHDTDDNGEEETFTRQWVIWHLIEHDLHHGGEISFALGMHSLAAIDLKSHIRSNSHPEAGASRPAMATEDIRSKTKPYRYFVDAGNHARFRTDILSNLTSDGHFSMGLKRGTIPRQQSTATAVCGSIEPYGQGFSPKVHFAQSRPRRPFVLR